MDYIERIGRVEELIELIANSLETKLNYTHLSDSKFPGISVKESDILYNDIRFKVCEYHGADVSSGNYINRITIEIPRNIDEDNRYVHVAWQQGYNRSSEVDNRRRACYEISRTFVKEVLPKVDFKIKKEVYNNEIDRILSVLD